MNPKSEKPRFFSGIAKKAANIAGVQFVSEQPQAPKQEFATAPTVNTNAPVLGEVHTTPVSFDKAAVSAVDAPAPVSPVPEVNQAGTPTEIPPVPEAIRTVFENDPESALNPTIVPPQENISATDVKPAVDAPPVVVPATPTEGFNSQNPDVQSVAPVTPPETPEDSLVNNPEPIVVFPSMAAPEIVPSDHVGEQDAEVKTGVVPNAFENAFKDNPEDHFDPVQGASVETDENPQENEIGVKVNPIAEKLIKENPGEFIRMNEKGEPEFDGAGFDEAVFVKEVQETPTFKNLLSQLEKRGITVETAMDVLRQFVQK